MYSIARFRNRIPGRSYQGIHIAMHEFYLHRTTIIVLLFPCFWSSNSCTCVIETLTLIMVNSFAVMPGYLNEIGTSR